MHVSSPTGLLGEPAKFPALAGIFELHNIHCLVHFWRTSDATNNPGSGAARWAQQGVAISQQKKPGTACSVAVGGYDRIPPLNFTF